MTYFNAIQNANFNDRDFVLNTARKYAILSEKEWESIQNYLKGKTDREDFDCMEMKIHKLERRHKAAKNWTISDDMREQRKDSFYFTDALIHFLHQIVKW